MNGLLALVNMFSAAMSDGERISSANALWMLLFDEGNQELFKAMDNAVGMITAHKVCYLIIVPSHLIFYTSMFE